MVTRDFDDCERWRRCAVIRPGEGRCWLVILSPSEVEAVGSLARAKAWARNELGVPVWWREDGAGWWHGYHLAKHTRQAWPKLFTREPA